MKNYRLDKGSKAHFSSLEELAKGFNVKIVPKQTKDKLKLAKQRVNFVKHCKHCGIVMTYLSDSNLVVCKNSKCKGEPHELKDREGNVIDVIFKPVFRMLDDEGTMIAANLFAEV